MIGDKNKMRTYRFRLAAQPFQNMLHDMQHEEELTLLHSLD